MLRRPTQSKSQDADKYLRDTDSRFVFAFDSGIYEPKSYYKEKKRKKLKFLTLSPFQWGTIILSAATLIFLIIYTHYVRLQWCEMKRTADYASEQTDMLHRQLSESLGAIVLIETYFQGGHGGAPTPGRNFADFHLINGGQVAASKASVEYEIRLENVPRNEKGKVLASHHFEIPIVLKEPPAGQRMPEDENQIASHRDWFEITEREVTRLKKTPTTNAIIIEGTFEYFNGFDEKKRATFCRAFSQENSFAGNGESCASFDTKWSKQ